MAFEWNDYDNHARGPAVKQACAAHGLTYTVWLTRPFTPAQVRQVCIDSGAAGIILEAEIPAEEGNGSPKPESVDWAQVVFQTRDLDIYKAVATNFAPFVHHDGTPYPEKAAPLVATGWACLTECYLGESPNSTPENTDFFARHLGWTETQPVIGIYGGKTWDDYPTRNNYRNWSVWDAGSVL